MLLASAVGIAACGSGLGGAAAAAEQYTYSSQWGSEGSSDGEFRIIGGLAWAEPYLYVTDTLDAQHYRIQVFDGSGIHQQSHTDWSEYRSAMGGIAVDAVGRMYTTVVNTFQVLSAAGQLALVRTADDFTPPRASFRPSDCALDSAGNVYVVESVMHQINKLSGTGQFLTSWGSEGSGDGQFNFVGGIAVGPNDEVYAVDLNNHRVQRFASDGQFVASWGSRGTADSQFINPRGVDVDGDGNVYVADWLNHRVQKFDPEGTFITKWGSRGTGDGEFEGPVDVAVTPDGSTAYVADLLNFRIQVFERTTN